MGRRLMGRTRTDSRGHRCSDRPPEGGLSTVPRYPRGAVATPPASVGRCYRMAVITNLTQLTMRSRRAVGVRWTPVTSRTRGSPAGPGRSSRGPLDRGARTVWSLSLRPRAVTAERPATPAPASSGATTDRRPQRAASPSILAFGPPDGPSTSPRSTIPVGMAPQRLSRFTGGGTRTPRRRPGPTRPQRRKCPRCVRGRRHYRTQ
jgi:hypothetical protein